ncbi:MAG: hypothetical protein IKN55_00050 [Oscillospiraceae bacterium]|nr:hypothetical protein [Oscillospiraceae bacterium]
MANHFDLAELALQGVCPNNHILYDDLGYPSIMVYVPKATYADLDLGTSTATFPAFIINGQEVPGIYIGKYQSIVMNNRAYSLPGVLNTSNITLDTAIARCTAKGAGWHLMTMVEHAALMLWCEQNGYMPIGNNNWGKHSSESIYTAIPGDFENGQRRRILTGTGPLTYYHDKSPAGIADLCGNVWEWMGGLRTVYGEVQVLINNNAADSDNSQAASSAAWRAINAADGTFITPNGSGTTSGSVKMDYISSKITYSTSITSQSDSGRNCTFGAITCDNTISDAAKLVLQALCLLPKSTTVLGASHLCYFNNGAAERSFVVGGSYNYSSFGACSFYGNNGRSTSSVAIGFRLAFAELPAA